MPHNSSNHKTEYNTYISENCAICGEEMTKIEDIWTDNESGNYYCFECKDYHKIDAVKCMDI